MGLLHLLMMQGGGGGGGGDAALELRVGDDAEEGDDDAEDGARVGLVLEDEEAQDEDEDGLEVPCLGGCVFVWGGVEWSCEYACSVLSLVG